MSHNNNSKPYSRRDFLSILGAVTSLRLFQSPAQILIESILAGVAQQSYAAAAGIRPRRLLHILQSGAPPRWYFDLFLNPYDPKFVANPCVGTKYGGGNTAAGAVYETISRAGMNVPPIWQYNVPAPNNTVRPMTDLLANMLQVRGINIGNPDHAAAIQMQFLPLGAAQSTSAFAADYADSPMPAVTIGTSHYRFKSLNAKSAVTVTGGGNLISTLLTPFLRKDLGGFALKRQAMEQALDASVSLLNTAAEQHHSGSRSISQATESAKDLLSLGFGNLTTTWNTLVAKYNDLISRSMGVSMVGINDRPIPPGTTKAYQLSEDSLITNSDLRSMITAQTTIGRMVASFAMAEFILLNQLSHSVSVNLTGVYNLTINGNAKSYLGADEHTTGNMISLIANSHYGVAYASCLLELINQLKAKNLFDETVIVTGGEFGRNPRNDGSGSDHGHTGGSSTFYCGAIKSPVVLGNIYLDRKQSTLDTGTWGYGAPVTGLGGPIDLGHWASTMATLLRVPSPITASSPLVIESSGTITPIVEKAKQV